MPNRQLHLFKSPRQRGIAPPSASEYQLHCAVVDSVRRWILPGWIYTHTASGEKARPDNRRQIEKDGRHRRIPDLVFFGPAG
jgi:hypothetical protein